jgi:S-adenosylmethionine:diacylglycerol 3-amino-3-carboxypropyl transferase
VTQISPALDLRPAPRASGRLVHEAVHRSRPLSRAGLSERLFTLAFSGLVYPQIWEDPRSILRPCRSPPTIMW